MTLWNVPLHPMLVHFPIALLTLAAVYGVLSLLRNSKKLNLAFWLHAATGGIGILLALASGLLESGRLTLSPEAQQALAIHINVAVASTFTVLAVLYTGLRWGIPPQKTYQKVTFAALLLLMTAFLWTTGHLGGVLVHRFGAGAV